MWLCSVRGHWLHTINPSKINQRNYFPQPANQQRSTVTRPTGLAAAAVERLTVRICRLAEQRDEDEEDGERDEEGEERLLQRLTARSRLAAPSAVPSRLCGAG